MNCLRFVGCLALGVGLEGQGHAVVAVALPGGARPVVEDVALVTAAAPAVVFRAGHDQLEVDAGANGCLLYTSPSPRD